MCISRLKIFEKIWYITKMKIEKYKKRTAPLKKKTNKQTKKKQVKDKNRPDCVQREGGKRGRLAVERFNAHLQLTLSHRSAASSDISKDPKCMAL